MGPAGHRLCLRCGHETYNHDAAAAAPPALVAAAAPIAQAPLHPIAPVPPMGPLRAVRVEQYAPSGLAFMAHLQLWRASRVCSDDSDSVKSAFESLEAAWFHGANEVANFCVSSVHDGVATCSTTFEWAPLPPQPPIPAGADPARRAELEAAAAAETSAFRRRRSRELLGQLSTARAILRIARAFARRRVVVDKTPKFYAIQPEKMSDEWFAIDAAEQELPTITAQDIELDAEHFRTSATALWWFLAATTFPINAMQTRLERLVKDFGVQYRTANAATFVPLAVWLNKHSPDAIARNRGKALPATPPEKRQRDDDDYLPQRGGTPARQSRRKRRARSRANRDAAAGASTSAPGTPATSLSTSTSTTGTPNTTTSRSTVQLGAPSPSPAASAASGGRGGPRGGTGGGRGRSGRGRF